MLCSASRVEGGEFICIYMRSEVSSKNLVACMVDLHAGMDQKVRWIAMMLLLGATCDQ